MPKPTLPEVPAHVGPHVHCVIPAGGLSPGHQRRVHPRYAFFLPVKVLSRVFRGKFVAGLRLLHHSGELCLPGALKPLNQEKIFRSFLRSLFRHDWVVYAKPPFAGPQSVLAYLSRYTHRVAISNQRLISFDQAGVTFRYKDYRRDGAERQQVMILATDEFIRRFLIHVLPRGFHRIRHYGLLASSTHKDAMALARKLLGVAAPIEDLEPDEPPDHRPPCPCCGGHMTIIETFARWCQPRAPPAPASPARRHTP